MSIRLQSTVVFRTIWLFLNRFGGNPIDHFKLHFTLFHTFVEEASFFTGVLSVLVTVALLTLKNMFQEVMSFFWQSRSEGLLKGHLPSSSQYPDICHVCRMEGRNDWGISYLACKEDPTTGFCQQNNFWYHWLSTWCDNIIKACKMSLIVLVQFQEMTPGSLSPHPQLMWWGREGGSRQQAQNYCWSGISQSPWLCLYFTVSFESQGLLLGIPPCFTQFQNFSAQSMLLT